MDNSVLYECPSLNSKCTKFFHLGYNADFTREILLCCHVKRRICKNRKSIGKLGTLHYKKGATALKLKLRLSYIYVSDVYEIDAWF